MTLSCWRKEGTLNKGTLKPSLLLFENEKPQSDFQACGFFGLTEFTFRQFCESILFLGLKVLTRRIRHSPLTALVLGSRAVWLASFQKVIAMFCCLFSRLTHRLGGSVYFRRCKILCKVSQRMFVTIL